MRLVHITTVALSFGFLRGQIGDGLARGLHISGIAAPGEELDALRRETGVAVAAVPMARRITPLQDLTAVWRIVRYLRRLRPHIVHAHTPKGGLLGMIASWVARVPVRVYDVWGLPYLTATGIRRILLLWSERLSCALAHRVLCVSHSLRDVAVADRVCRADKMSVFLRGSGHGVDATGRFDPRRLPTARTDVRDHLGIPRDAVVIGFVGRIVRDKGLVELADAWARLRDRYANLHLLVAGRFEPEDPVPPDVEAALRGDSRIHLAGWSTDTPPLYAAMDVVVLPTYREGFPNVPLEAAAMSLPVVATRIPGCIDAVEDGVTGILVPPRDAAALADAIAAYLDDPHRRTGHGQAGRDRVLRDFRREPLWEALHEEYERLLRARVPAQHVRRAIALGDGA